MQRRSFIASLIAACAVPLGKVFAAKRTLKADDVFEVGNGSHACDTNAGGFSLYHDDSTTVCRGTRAHEIGNRRIVELFTPEGRIRCRMRDIRKGDVFIVTEPDGKTVGAFRAMDNGCDIAGLGTVVGETLSQKQFLLVEKSC